MKEKIAGMDARKRKVNVNGVGRMDGVADQVGKVMDVMEAWELKGWGTYVPEKVTIDVKYFVNLHLISQKYFFILHNQATYVFLVIQKLIVDVENEVDGAGKDEKEQVCGKRP